MMKLKLTKHFYERLIERWGSLEVVRQTILNPDKIEEQGDKKIKYLKFDGKKYIHVVVSRNEEWYYVLITYYKTTKVKLIK